MRYVLAALTVACCCFAALDVVAASDKSDAALAAQFQSPPDSARPWVYWFWVAGNITREGITADLEAMQRVGIGGVLIMDVDQPNPNALVQFGPRGPVRFASPEWRELFCHAVAEAKRLGLEVNMNNDAGWCGSAGPWITPELAMQHVVWSETALEGPQKFDAPLARPQPPPPPGLADYYPPIATDYYRDIAVLAFPAPAADANPQKQIKRSDIIDITSRLQNDGRLSWDIPAGKWTILRLGHMPDGVTNHPASTSGTGLECDKLSKEAIDAHFAGLMAKLIADVGPDAAKALAWTHVDSWESHSQDWTPRMREEFKHRRGYDPLLLLAGKAGWTVDNAEVSSRFVWDMRKTIAELVNDNYAGRLQELAHQHGMRLSLEAYGDGPFDALSYAGRSDSPMGEFWVGFDAGGTVRAMASAAHTYGKRIVGAEAFTGIPDSSKWMEHPFSLKPLGDAAFCDGVNRFVFHRYAHQPWLDRKPGMTMGPFGVHYERTETWWEQTRPWHEYLARCNYLLQQGLFVADICYLQTENSPSSGGMSHFARTAYDFDGCSPEVVLTRMQVRDGRLVLPDGMSYRILVLPPGDTMTPELLAKIKELVEAGATVVGPRPVKSPSLSGYPDCDAQVAKLAAALWGDCNGKTTTEHRHGKGRIVWGKTPESVLAEMDVPPDFRHVVLSGSGPIRYIHRTVDGTDVFFVANSASQAVYLEGFFRVKGSRPEFWWPDTGRIERVAVYDETAEGTCLPISLGPCGSVFVVFRPDAAPVPDRVVTVTRDREPVIEANPLAAEVVIQKAVYGVPGDSARTRDVTARVRQLVARDNYDFQVAAMAEGDDPALGVVKALSIEYTVNGKQQTVQATDPERISLVCSSTSAMPTTRVQYSNDGRLHIEVCKSGHYEVITASGKKVQRDLPAIPEPPELTGPWDLRFPPDSGGPRHITLDNLISWSQHPDIDVKYFSGTATYNKTFQVPNGTIANNHRVYLDLGRVQVIANAKLNGKSLGILWKPPFRVDITDAVKTGNNELEVQVVNLWPNRLIGDEQLPDDRKWGPPYHWMPGAWGGEPLAEWPQWLLDGKPSPTGRLTFTVWRLWTKDSSLLESGLLGPVQIVVTASVPLPN